MAKRLNKLNFCNIPSVLRSTNTIVRAGEFKFEALKRVSNERTVDLDRLVEGEAPTVRSTLARPSSPNPTYGIQIDMKPGRVERQLKNYSVKILHTDFSTRFFSQ